MSLEDLKDKKTRAKVDAYMVHKKATNKDRAVLELAARYNVSKATIYRWIAEVKAWDSRPRITLGDVEFELPKTRKFCPDAVRFGLSVYAANIHAGMKAAYKALQIEADRQGWKIGEYCNFTRLIKKVPVIVWDRVAKGDIYLEMAHVPKIIRSWLAVPVYAVLCGDQKVTDYYVVMPETGEVMVLNYYLWMDCTSRAWVGLWPALGPYNKYTVGYSLMQALRLGIPDKIFTDWGKPELSGYVEKLRERLNMASIRTPGADEYSQKYGQMDGIKHVKAQPGKPWKKPIENQMNIFEKMLFEKFAKGFRKREADSWINKQRQQKIKKLRKEGRLFTVREFLEICVDIMKEHNMRPMQAKELGGEKIIPQEILEKGIQSRTRFDEKTLELLCLPYEERKITQSLVRVKVAKGDLRHYLVPAHVISRLGQGAKVVVNFDPFDGDKPAILSSLEGEFLGEAMRWRAANDDNLAEYNRIQAEYFRYFKVLKSIKNPHVRALKIPHPI